MSFIWLQNCYGTARAVSVLRGSKAKNIERWMMELQDHHDNPLHGAGSNRSDDWWKGLAGVLMGEGYLQTLHKSVSHFDTCSYGINMQHSIWVHCQCI